MGNYNHKEVEKDQIRLWKEKELFKTPDIKNNSDTYTIVLPPPNVTGRLHMGHALDVSLQDVLIRFNALRGKNVDWKVGTDHAGIATQALVEKKLSKDGINTNKISKEELLGHIWRWRDENGGLIIEQIKRIGAAADWDNAWFTMDEKFSNIVRLVFIDLYKSGLIYKGPRMVNWDCKLKTAISDLEVVSKEEKGKIWYIKYPFVKDANSKENGSEDGIVIATTRPETLFGDEAVMVHPDDDRYKGMTNLSLRVPICDKVVPIIEDEMVDIKTGSGAVKVTPAHDFNDFQVGQKHNLKVSNIFDDRGKLNELAGDKYNGMDRFEARTHIIKELSEKGFLVKEEKHDHAIPYGDRSGTIIEPRISEQWFLDTENMAQLCKESLDKKEVEFVPESWKNNFFSWMKDIKPWCISRQIKWGHEIPAWHYENEKGEKSYIVAADEEEAKEQAIKNGFQGNLVKEEGVLDTWFSSALWPMITLGWKGPGDNDFVNTTERFPTDVLVTGFDILFFWVARMMMFGIHFTGRVPFKHVYFHALVRDSKGQKMSKSKGNIIDPLDLADTYGMDALRWALLHKAVPGRDIKLSEQDVKGGRNFITKIFNAGRFCMENSSAASKERDLNDGFDMDHPVHHWLLNRAQCVREEIEESIKNYRFDTAANSFYHFLWNVFCDWYLEFSKFMIKDDRVKDETDRMLSYMFKNILILAHPFIPFVTEYLWGIINGEESFLYQNNIGKYNFDIDSKKVELVEKFISNKGNSVSPKMWIEENISELFD